MKALLSALVLTFGLNAQATTPLVKKMQNFISDKKNQEMFYECAYNDQFGRDELPQCKGLHARYIQKLANATGADFRALKNSEVPFDVKYELKKQNLSSSCRDWTGCSYVSPDGEYGYSESLLNVFLVNNKYHFAVYSGFGGEWARESSDLFFYIIDENMKQVSKQSFVTWSD